MRIKIIFAVAMSIACFLSALGYSQTYQATKNVPDRLLLVGDTLPDYKFKLMNYPTKTAKFSDFKGKLLILDFWSSNCASCIQSWPKLLSLQDEFREEIQIMLVNTHQDESTVLKTFEKRKAISGVDMTLPNISQDQLLGEKWFNHSGDPHVVWVNPEGILISVTGGNELNAENIEAILKKGNTNMVQKVDLLKTAYGKPLFIKGNGGDGQNILWYSTLSGYVPGIIATSAIIPQANGHKTIIVTNTSIKNMYAYAFSRGTDTYGYVKAEPLNRVVVQAKDTSKYLNMVDGIYQYQNYYTYQLVSPPVTRQRLLKMMQEDLKRYFGMEVFHEKRKIPCLVFSAEDTSRISYKQGTQVLSIGLNSFHVNKSTMEDVIKRMEKSTSYYSSPYPLVDETGIKGLIGEIKLETDVSNYRELDKALMAYGMSLQVKDREIEMLIIKEPDY